MDRASTFAEALRRHRNARGLTQEGLAERAHLSERTISDLERGLKSPQRATLRLLVIALELQDREADELARAARARRLPAEASASREPRPNLPVPVTSFIGREEELHDVRALLLRDDVRLVTLTGPGGVGKTRIGLSVAVALVDDFADGVCFVPLARVSDPSLVAAAIGEALGMPEGVGKSIAQGLEEYVRSKALLLVLDDADRITSAAALVGALLGASPRLKVLVTSRTLLRVYGEHGYTVAPLELPAPQRPGSASDASRFAAIRLFMDRATAAYPDFRVGDADAESLVEICRRLDGLPLAIELAAARIRLFPPRLLLTRLDHRLPILTGGARDLPARHRTMRDTIGWSVELLSSQERVLFQRIAVFAGGCRLEAAEAVCNPNGDLGIDVLAGLEVLLDHSLIEHYAGADGEPRFGMLETIREYALEQLEASGEASETWYRYAEVYVALGESAEAELTGPGQAAWLSRLEAEVDNLRAVLGWSLTNDALGFGLKLAGSIWRFWHRHGYVSEGRVWMEEALTRSATVEPAVRAKALVAAGELACAVGDVRRAMVWCQLSLDLYEALGDLSGKARSLHILAWSAAACATTDADYAAAAALQETCLALEQKIRDPWGEAKALHELGEIARYRRDFLSATALLDQALHLRLGLGDHEGCAWSLHCLAWTEYDGGNYQGARRRASEALSMWQELGHEIGIAATSSLRARIAWRLGEGARGCREVHESLRRWPRLHHREWLEFDLLVLAGIVQTCQTGRPGARRAARLLGASEALSDSAGLPLPRQSELAEIWQQIRTRLDERLLEVTRMTGRNMDAERAAQYATAIAIRSCPEDERHG